MTASPTDLIGEWDFSRDIVDTRAAQQGTAAGRLVLRDDPDGIDWREDGQLDWNGRVCPVNRSYRFRLTPDGWWVQFSDGRPFHPWLPGEWVEHQCGADTYRGLVTMSGPDSWSTCWVIDGPAKTTRIVTHYRHAASPTP